MAHIIFKSFLLLVLFPTYLFAELNLVPTIYLPKNNNLPLEYYYEINRVFLHNSKVKLVPTTPQLKLKSHEKVFHYELVNNKIIYQLGDKKLSFNLTEDLSQNQKIIREKAFEFIHGKAELDKVLTKENFHKNIIIPKIKKKTKHLKVAKVKKKKPTQKRLPKTAAKQEIKATHLPSPKPVIKVTKRDLKLLIGFNIYYDGNPAYNSSSMKQSLSIEAGVRKQKLSVTYEHRFFNHVANEVKEIENRFNLLNLRYQLSSFNILSTPIKLNSKFGLGIYSHKNINTSNEVETLFLFGGGIIVKKIVKFGLHYESAPNSNSYSSVVSGFIGAGINF